jgi:uncharacterized Zn finger protein
MSRWNDFAWYKSPPKPPPKHGIKVKQTGTTWWGQRWIEALAAVLRGDARRLSRGRMYARAGRTHDLVITGGEVTAKVAGSRPTPYRVTIQIAQLPASAWSKAIAGMAKQAQFAAELLAGRMPKQIVDVFRGAGTNLFPAQRDDLVTSCTCPDWGDPCKHVAAAHYVLGEALDRDPFLLFELRGRTKAEVLDALRLARTRDAGTRPARGRPARAAAAIEPAILGVTLGARDLDAYDRPREAFPAWRASFDEPEAHSAVLRQLGAPAAWSSSTSPAELLAPIIRAAAARARSIALAEPDADSAAAAPAADSAAAPPAKRSSKRQRSTLRAKPNHVKAPAEPMEPHPQPSQGRRRMKPAPEGALGRGS